LRIFHFEKPLSKKKINYYTLIKMEMGVLF